MLPFFKKKDGKKPQLEGAESTVSSDELLEEGESAASGNEEVMTELSIHPAWNVPKEDQYSFQFLNMECPPLKPNQLSLSGINIMEESKGVYRVTAFVRNSLDKAVELKETNLVLLNPKDEVIGRKTFDLSGLEKLPGRSSRPWHFYFSADDLFVDEVPMEGWKLAFQLKPSSRKHSLDLAQSWQSSLAEGSKKQLEEMVERLDPPKTGEVNFMGLKAEQKENGDLHVTILVRNGSEKSIHLQELPLEVTDASGEVVARGGFKLEDFSVKANTSKPWTFIFPVSMLNNETLDLSSWSAAPPKQAKTSIQSK
ncbi:accessory Sec system S-layer assembly protein [Salsuginibacillus kocurii]|uniref:accessory Sec system S-layer assembly protein n=1 Tax=Salsuginibacillus kocurii TaxID=427078 RepID=UPI0003604A46|nr:accessory Sec system S-layer assembly protein [Salsuginibacillus kocurii]